jgi:hypothetical protein
MERETRLSNTQIATLVFSGPRLFHMLPRHFFADDETFAKVAALIEAKLGTPR